MNTSLLKREGVREKIEGRWKQFQQLPTGSAFGKFVGALQATTKLCRRLGKKFQAKANRKEKLLREEFASLQRAAKDDLLTEEEETLFSQVRMELVQFEETRAHGWELRAKVLSGLKMGTSLVAFSSPSYEDLDIFTTSPWNWQERLARMIRQVLRRRGSGIRFGNIFRTYIGETPSSRWSSFWNRVYKDFPRKLSVHQAEKLEQPFTMEVLKEALKSMPLRKSPGNDGVPPEFFVWGWDFVKNLLLGAITDVWEMGTMGPTFNESLISLLPKANAQLSLDNWRPISLLTTFYKIIAKMLASRIAPHMDE